MECRCHSSSTANNTSQCNRDGASTLRGCRRASMSSGHGSSRMCRKAAQCGCLHWIEARTADRATADRRPAHQITLLLAETEIKRCSGYLPNSVLTAIWTAISCNLDRFAQTNTRSPRPKLNSRKQTTTAEKNPDPQVARDCAQPTTLGREQSRR